MRRTDERKFGRESEILKKEREEHINKKREIKGVSDKENKEN